MDDNFATEADQRAVVVSKNDCESCGTRKGENHYANGDSFCHKCKTFKPGAETKAKRTRVKYAKKLISDVEFRPLKKRKLSDQTTRKFSFGVAHLSHPITDDPAIAQVASYFNAAGDTIVAQTLRWADGSARTLGDIEQSVLFGAQLWRDSGKRIVVTHDPINCMSVSELQNNKWPVVALNCEIEDAADAVRKNSEMLEQFEEVVFLFDPSAEWTEAAQDCARVIKPGKAKLATLPEDANAMKRAGRGKEVIDALWGAKTYRPDGIIDGRTVTLADLKAKPVIGYETGFPILDEMTFGLRMGEFTMFTAGTGIGKSTIVRQIGHKFATQDTLRLGNVFLEESSQKTMQGYAALDHQVPLGHLRRDPSLISDDQYTQTLGRIFHTGRVHFHNHFGSLDQKTLLDKLRYFAVGLECQFILFDHVNIAVSGNASDNERKDLDVLMTTIRSLIEETGVGVIGICHLNMNDAGGGKKAHEEGGRVTLKHLRGSGALKQISDTIIALERDQQTEDEELKDVSRIRILKVREFGQTGLAGLARYCHRTGLLLPHTVPINESGAPAREEDYGF